MRVEPVTLTGRHVRLEPLSEAHVPDLAIAGRDPEIWQWMPYGEVTSEPRMFDWVRDLLARQARGTDLPFAVIAASTGRAVGCTRYLDIQVAHRALEVGGTWYATEHQRTAVNTECKLLIVGHAFEGIGANRVQFKTDLRNVRSQRALERIGAVREGVLREHMLMPDGHLRSSAYYSILAREWPSVKDRLEAKLASP